LDYASASSVDLQCPSSVEMAPRRSTEGRRKKGGREKEKGPVLSPFKYLQASARVILSGERGKEGRKKGGGEKEKKRKRKKKSTLPKPRAILYCPGAYEEPRWQERRGGEKKGFVLYLLNIFTNSEFKTKKNGIAAAIW